ncbi:hypothetical protein [Rhodococcus qingshengii]|uniref:hypothetical protein n=1 Tax=Rhodococcus qingshengii TaxID=334542 RepID=UPI001C8B5130|nr:hypothetical protein [Rhodococcus qingshengii]MBX9150028.1 hypothetical protein [Rhodococcus qingshengii]
MFDADIGNNAFKSLHLPICGPIDLAPQARRKNAVDHRKALNAMRQYVHRNAKLIRSANRGTGLAQRDFHQPHGWDQVNRGDLVRLLAITRTTRRRMKPEVGLTECSFANRQLVAEQDQVPSCVERAVAATDRDRAHFGYTAGVCFT